MVMSDQTAKLSLAAGTLVLLPTAAILSNINNIGKRIDGLDDAVHQCAIQCAMHAQEHGDVMLADRLVKALGGNNSLVAIEAAVKEGREPFKMGRFTGYNVKGLVMWFIRYTPVAWNADGKPGMLKAGMGLYEQLLNRNEGHAWNLLDAEANPFWTLDEVKRDVQRQPFTIDSLNTIVVNLRERISKSVGAGTFKGDKDAALAYVAVPEEDPTKIILPTDPSVKGAVPFVKAEKVGPEPGDIVKEPLQQAAVNG